MILYNILRPLITRGDIQNIESVGNISLVEQAIKLEKSKYSKERIMKYYYDSLNRLFNIVSDEKEISSVLDVGCATGDVVSKIAIKAPKASFLAIDIMEQAIAAAKKKYIKIENLHFETKDFLGENIVGKYDLVMCLQTLEHIEDFILEDFIRKIFELAHQAVILSVPREPIWSLANICRFKYLSRFGNSPHHLQHWRKTTFEGFIMKIARKFWKNAEIITLSPIKLWTIVLLKRIG